MSAVLEQPALRIHNVPLHMLDDIWPLVAPMLERASRHNPHLDIEDIPIMLRAQFAQLVIAIEGIEIAAAAVMERHRYPRHVVANIMLLAGKPGTMGARLDQITQHLFRWARTMGCDRIALIGLPGLARVVKRHGGQQIKLIHAWRDL